ncbi:hypothetical protein AB4Z54_69225, partial [Streptomyces sp. MCAF7]
EILAVANFIAAPYGTKEQRLIDYGVEGVHHTLKHGAPVKNSKGVTEVQDTYRFIVSPEATVAYPDFPQMVKDYCGWMQRMGKFAKKPVFYGMQIQEPNPDFKIQGMDYFGADGGDPTLYLGPPANIWSFLNKNLSKDRIE